MIASKPDPQHYVKRLKDEMSDLVDHLRGDLRAVDEPQCRALFETSAEVVNGLITAFSHYQEKTEVAWK